MFRDKPSAYDRLSDAVGDIGHRIAELERQTVGRFNPAPSAPERWRQAALRHLPGRSPSSFMPEFLSGWSLPTADDARASYRTATEGLGELKTSLADLRRHLPDIARRARRFERRAPAPISKRGFADLGDRPALTTLLVVGGTFALVGTAFYVTKKIADHTEEPDYDTVRKDGDIEIRDYDGMVVAETIKSGYHEKARKLGFEALAAYIFAQNRGGKKIAMTAPVLQQLSENEGETKGWAIRFVMPKKYTLASLPAPAGTGISLKEVPAKRVAAIRFNGNFTASLASKKLMVLYNYLSDENLKQKSDPEYAFYNPPWTPGFLKRNEILIEIER